MQSFRGDNWLRSIRPGHRSNVQNDCDQTEFAKQQQVGLHLDHWPRLHQCHEQVRLLWLHLRPHFPLGLEKEWLESDHWVQSEMVHRCMYVPLILVRVVWMHTQHRASPCRRTYREMLHPYFSMIVFVHGTLFANHFEGTGCCMSSWRWVFQIGCSDTFSIHIEIPASCGGMICAHCSSKL